MAENEFEAYTSSKGLFLGPLTKRGLIEPFKTNLRNVAHFKQTIMDCIDNSADEDSVYKLQRKSGKFTKYECVIDSIGMIFAGFDTTARNVCSTLYYLKKYPDKHSKIMEAIKNSELDTPEKFDALTLRDKYQDCDYLTFSMKEGLRIDSPTVQSLYYE